MRFGGLWRHPDFVKLWAGESVSQFGSLVGGIALGFLAILVLGATPFEIALLAICSRLPGFLTGLVAGVWVDRLHRRPIMIVSDCGRAVLLASIPAAALLGILRIEQLYVVAFLVGILTTFFDVAYQSYLPTLVPRADLVEGNSKLAATAAAAEVGGFGIAGWLVQIFTAPLAILVDAASFLVSAVCIALIGAAEPAPSERPREQGALREAIEGLRTVLEHPYLRATAGATMIFQLSFQIYGAVISLFALRELGFAPGVLGMIYGVGGISSLLGSVLAARAGRRLGIGPAMVLGGLAMGISMFFVPLAPGATILGAGLLLAQQLFGDGCYMVYDITELSLRQTITPDHVLGRVNASVRAGGLAAMLVGSLAGGILGGAIGLRPTLAIGACGTILGAVWLALSPVRSLREAAPMAVRPT